MELCAGGNMFGFKKGSYHREVVNKLGKSALAFEERFTFYVTNKGRALDGSTRQVLIPDWKKHVQDMQFLLGCINGGATATAPADGLYFDTIDDQAVEVWEKTVLVYSFIQRQPFRENLPALRALMHKFGRETNQGAIYFEFDGFAYQINEPYDPL